MVFAGGEALWLNGGVFATKVNLKRELFGEIGFLGYDLNYYSYKN
jgi:hypothetical protein